MDVDQLSMNNTNNSINNSDEKDNSSKQDSQHVVRGENHDKSMSVGPTADSSGHDDDDDESDGSDESGSELSSHSSSGSSSTSSSSSGSSDDSSNDSDSDKSSIKQQKTNNTTINAPKVTAKNESDDNETIETIAPHTLQSQSVNYGCNKEDIQQILENFPDALRRSSRSRKEPDRFQAETYGDDSDDSDSKAKRRQRKRKDSDEWKNRNRVDNYDDDDEDDDDDDTDSEDFDSDPEHRSSKRSRNFRKNRQRPQSNRRASQRAMAATKKSFSESESDDDDDESIGRSRRNSSTGSSNRKKTSRRTTVNQAISYKEESDYTDSDDLIADSNTNEDGQNGSSQVIEFEEEEGEMIEKVLEHRMGRLGATGPKTASYQIDENGDPNAGCTDDSDEPKEIQFLIKWKGWSYIHCTWESRQSLEEQKARGVKKIELYQKRDEEIRIWKKTASPEDIDYYEGQEELNSQLRQLHLNVERVIAHQPPKIGVSETCFPEYLCKWDGLPYGECTWEDGALISKKFKSKVNEYYQREKSQNIPAKYCRVLKQRPKFVPMKTQPSFIGGPDQLKLRDYQLDGLNWLAQSWCRDNSVILADEMGLGKTIQTISFLNYLYNHHQLFGPFLLVVPLSTLAAWQKEFENWAQSMNVVVYIGDATSRHMIREYEWYSQGTTQRIKFNVLLTTYEILMREKSLLALVPWAVLGVDEAHRLKNDESFLYKCLSTFDTNFRLLITGTPLQNSLRELWALLHFIMPNRFDSWEFFESEHKDAYQKGFSKLHSQLQQYLIRRVKKDVEKSLPAKVEQILRVDMTSIQKQFYKWILTKNYKALSKGVKGSVSSFTNIVMELKKCCNHASLVRPFDEYANLDPLQQLIRGSGKLLLLDKLLCRLKETGHRVLIFSQMVRMLDLLGEYLSLRRFAYQRLDGSIRGEFRKQALEHFNAEGSQDFCFLLSTRAGGLGINLATADTVIIFDSDWNPQNDLQAQARAHRIGQKNQVNIYRLVTKASVEEDIIERAKRKMVLDHLVIQRMDTSGHTFMSSSNNLTTTLQDTNNSTKTTPFNKEELSAILKFGAQELFKETETDNEEPQCDIDEILKRAETREDDDGPQTLGDELLNSFKVASFNFNEEEDVQAVSSGITSGEQNQKDWDEIIPESERIKFENDERHKEEIEMMVPRCRNKSRMDRGHGNQSDSCDEYDPNAKNESGSDESDGDRPRRRGRPKSSYKELIKGFSEQEVRRFIKSYRKFPTPMNRLESIAIDAELQEKPLPDLQQLAMQLEESCRIAIKESETKNQSHESGTAKKNNRGPSFKLGGVTVFARGILSTQKDLEPLSIMLPTNPEERKKWVLTGIKIKSASWDCPWTIEDDSRLLAGVYEYGLGSWEAIKMDPSYKLADKMLPDGDRKPQPKQLQSRVEFLLKIMHRHLAPQQKTSVESSQINHVITTKNKNNKTKNKESIKLASPSSPSSLSTKKNSSGKNKNKSAVNGTPENKKHKEKKKRKDKKRKKEKKSSSSITNQTSKKQHLSDSAADSTTTNCSNYSIRSVDELNDEIFSECKEKMRAMKKTLKALNKVEELSNSEHRERFYEYVSLIGAHIDKCLLDYNQDSTKMREWRNNLWTFVSKFTDLPAKKLYKHYRKLKQTKQVSSSSHHHDRHHHYPSSKSSSSMEKGLSMNQAGSSATNRMNEHYHHSNDRYDNRMSMNRGGGDYRNSSNHQYPRQPPSLTPGQSSGLKRDYHGSNVSSGPIAGIGGGPPVKFSKHSYHDRRSDYDRSSGGHHGGSSWSSKHDGYRNNSSGTGVYNDSNRYYHHSSSPNKNNTPYNNRSNDHQQRPYDQRSQRPPNMAPMGYNRHLPPPPPLPLVGTTTNLYPSNGGASSNPHMHHHQSWNSGGSTPALLPTPQPIQPAIISSPNSVPR